MRYSLRIVDRKSEGKISLDITIFRWHDNITMDPKEMRCDNVDRTHLPRTGAQESTSVT
jgi:hypothetical protein